MACSGKVFVDTLSFNAMLLSELLWALLFYTIAICVDSIPIQDATLRPSAPQPPLQHRIWTKFWRRKPSNLDDPKDIPLMQIFSKGSYYSRHNSNNYHIQAALDTFSAQKQLKSLGTTFYTTLRKFKHMKCLCSIYIVYQNASECLTFSDIRFGL